MSVASLGSQDLFHFRSPSVGVDENSDLDIPIVLTDQLCADFTSHDRQMVKAMLDDIYSIAPVEGFKLLLVAAIAVHARVTSTGASSHPIVCRWRDNIHIATAEFCNTIGLPAILDDVASEDTSVCTVSLVYMPVDIPPTPSFGSDLLVEKTPSPPVPSALVVEAPMPTARLPRGWPRGPAPLIEPAARQGGPVPLSSKGKQAQGQPLAAPPPTKHVSFAAAAASTPPKPAPAPRPSLVLSIPGASLANSLLAQSALHADIAAFVCTEALGTHPSFADVQVSAARWTPKGNLDNFWGSRYLTRAPPFCFPHPIDCNPGQALNFGPPLYLCTREC